MKRKECEDCPHCVFSDRLFQECNRIFVKCPFDAIEEWESKHKEGYIPKRRNIIIGRKQ